MATCCPGSVASVHVPLSSPAALAMQDLYEHRAAMWVSRVPDPTLEPELTLCNWQVIAPVDQPRVLIGHCVERFAARISTAIREFDVTEMRVTTVSGRVYRLEGPPDVDPDAAALWRLAAQARKLDTWTDVSAVIWKDHEATLQRAIDNNSDLL